MGGGGGGKLPPQHWLRGKQWPAATVWPPGWLCTNLLGPNKVIDRTAISCTGSTYMQIMLLYIYTEVYIGKYVLQVKEKALL